MTPDSTNAPVSSGAPAHADSPATQSAASPRPSGSGGGYVWGTGRRKTSVARVRVKHGNGIYKINDKAVEAFLSEERDRNAVVAPIAAVSMTGKVDVLVTVDGGGFAGQAGAIVMGLARALTKLDSSLEAALRDGGFMTRDDRMVERKKPGMAGARKRFQFSKR